METKFTSKKEKVAIDTELNINGINVSITVFGEKKVTGNGEQLSSGQVNGHSNQVFQKDELDKLKGFDIHALIAKAVEDFQKQ